MLVLAVKGLVGGTFVVGFALLGQVLEPKRFAGLLSAAPAVALAGLTITLIDKGAHDARLASVGMIAGGVGMIAYAASVIPLLRRTRASVAAFTAVAIWTAVAVVVAVPLLAL